MIVRIEVEIPPEELAALQERMLENFMRHAGPRQTADAMRVLCAAGAEAMVRAWQEAVTGIMTQGSGLSSAAKSSAPSPGGNGR